MDPQLRAALTIGYERLSAWSDLLDQINVFPVADADTGRNLKISLAPLRQLEALCRGLADRLVQAATGNSGNIDVLHGPVTAPFDHEGGHDRIEQAVFAGEGASAPDAPAGFSLGRCPDGSDSDDARWNRIAVVAARARCDVGGRAGYDVGDLWGDGRRIPSCFPGSGMGVGLLPACADLVGGSTGPACGVGTSTQGFGSC